MRSRGRAFAIWGPNQRGGAFEAYFVTHNRNSNQEALAGRSLPDPGVSRVPRSASRSADKAVLTLGKGPARALIDDHAPEAWFPRLGVVVVSLRRIWPGCWHLTSGQRCYGRRAGAAVGFERCQTAPCLLSIG